MFQAFRRVRALPSVPLLLLRELVPAPPAPPPPARHRSEAATPTLEADRGRRQADDPQNAR
jgi:hypothetical protein